MADLPNSSSSAPIHQEYIPNSGLSDIANEILASPDPIEDLGSEAEVVPVAKLKEKAKEKARPEAKKAATPAPLDGGEDPEDYADVVGGLEEDDAQVQKKTWKLKANGKEYDIDSEEKLVAAAQRGIAFQQQFEKMRNDIDAMKSNLQAKLKEAEDRDALIERDPAAYIKSRNGKAEDIMEQILLDRAKEAMAMENMTPRERDLFLQNRQYQERLKNQEEMEATKAKENESRLVEEQKTQLGNLFSGALKAAKLPANPTTVRVMAAVYRAALNKGVELTETQAAELTKRQLEQIHQAMSPDMETLDPAEFIEKYPKLTDAIRKHLIARARSGGQPNEVQNVPRQRKPDGKYKANPPDQDKEWDKWIKKQVQDGSALRVKNGW